MTWSDQTGLVAGQLMHKVGQTFGCPITNPSPLLFGHVTDHVIFFFVVPSPTVNSVNPVAIGTNVTLTCTIDGVLSGTNVSYQWTKNGVSLSDGGSITGSNQSNLTITNVGSVDQGRYGCNISVDEFTNTSNAVSLTLFRKWQY